MKEKCFASFDLKRLPIITSGTSKSDSYIVIYVATVKGTENFKYLN